MPFRTPEKIPYIQKRLVHSGLWHTYETNFALFGERWEQSREQHVFRIVWYHTLRGKALKIRDIANISGVPRQTLQQGKDGGMLPKMARDGRLRRLGRSQYYIPWEMLHATTVPGPDGMTRIDEMTAAVHAASAALHKIEAKERRADKKKPRKKSP